MKVFEAGGRSRRVLELIADKWAVPAVSALAEGTKRHNQLHREIEGVSQKNLQRDGLVRREYSLTRLGESLIGILSEPCKWAEEYIEEVDASRERYDDLYEKRDSSGWWSAQQPRVRG